MRPSRAVAISAASGVILTVAVAWGAALAAPGLAPPQRVAARKVGGWSITGVIDRHADATLHFGYVRRAVVYWDARSAEYSRPDYAELEGGFGAAADLFPMGAPPPDDPPYVCVDSCEEIAGWPLLCLSSVSQQARLDPGADPNRYEQRPCGFRIPWIRPLADWTGTRCLPLSPSPASFLADVAFWSSPALIVIGSLELRRAIRRQRGQCGRCGYRLSSDRPAACPECGEGQPLSSGDKRVERC